MKKRRALVAVSLEFFKAISTQRGETLCCVSNDIPADAVLIGASYDWSADRLILCFESASLPETEDGHALPFLKGPVVHANKQPETPVRFREFL